MTSSEHLQRELHAASVKVLMERAVHGSILYPVLTFVLLIVTDWRTDHLALGLVFWAFVAATAAVRFGYLSWLLKRPHTYTNRSPPGLTLAILGPSIVFGIHAATTYSLFGVESATSALTLMLVFGVAAAGTSSLAMDRRVHTLFTLSLLVPVGLVSLAEGTIATVGCALFVALYFAFLRREGISANTTFVQLFERGLALQQAVGDLEAKQTQLVVAHDSMRLVMDSVEEGLCIVDKGGILKSQGSTAFEEWFGRAVPGTLFVEQVEDTKFASWFEVSIEMLGDDLLPVEVVIDQMPRSLMHRGRHLAVSYQPVEREGTIVGLLMVISDITERVAIEQAESEQRELAQLFQLLARDPDGFREFRVSATAMVAAVAKVSPRIEQLRALHTLKGNAGLMGITSLAQVCHSLEDELADHTGPVDEEQAGRLVAAWDKTDARMRGILGEREHVIELSMAEYSSFLKLVGEEAPHNLMLALAADWRLESVPRRFDRLAQQALRVGRALGKEIHVDVDVPPLRLDRDRWRDLWMACTHLLRNAVDHGIEDVDTRIERGKPAMGTVRLSAVSGPDEVVIRFGDDGQGINWSEVSVKAQSRGLPVDSSEALQEALFSDGVSTRAEVTDISGRGVGLGAVAQEARRLGGTIDVISTEGIGTEFVIRIPRAGVRSGRADVARGVA